MWNRLHVANLRLIQKYDLEYQILLETDWIWRMLMFKGYYIWFGFRFYKQKNKPNTLEYFKSKHKHHSLGPAKIINTLLRCANVYGLLHIIRFFWLNECGGHKNMFTVYGDLYPI